MNDFLGFRFGNIHSSDLHLIVVSSSDRYSKNSLPEIKDYSVEVPGGNGSTYFGSSFSTRDFSLKVAFDNINEKIWRKISQLFGDNRLRDLVFDELPYKTYRAKIKSKPEFKFICFTDRDTGERVYKGDGTLVFTCYFPFAFGFNKYITRAADYYKTTPPKEIIKNCQNVIGNMNSVWKGGYPTIEQVQNGELFFKAPFPSNKDKIGQSINPNDKVLEDSVERQKEHCLIDVRGYWDNVPEWADSSKLLISPTLDFDKELIYLPQYSRNNYINMDIGINNENALIGARLLVYNPGDLPMDFNLEMNFNNDRFKLFEDLRVKNRFQIRRRNVQRLTIPQAVEWTGIKTYLDEDNEYYKFGNRYVTYKRYTEEEENTKIINGTIISGNNLAQSDPNKMILYRFSNGYLGENHPNHLYISEPIPQEQLGRYIKMFYYQSKDLDYQTGDQMAERYEELRDLCIDDEERNQLYWETLYSLFKNYSKNLRISKGDLDLSTDLDIFINFFTNYIYQPQEFLVKDKNINYGEEIFNITTFPQYYTDDYLEIEFSQNNKDNLTLNKSYHLDSEKKMLYNIIEEENQFEKKDKKLILNDYIVQGKWFQIPTGWSLIEIMPVINEKDWIGKKWMDARAFDWGYSTNNTPSFLKDKYSSSSNIVSSEYARAVFNKVYQNALDDYLGTVEKISDTQSIYKKGLSGYNHVETALGDGLDEIEGWQERASNFRLWYNDENFKNDFQEQYNLNRTIKAELEFLKIIQQYWRAASKYTLSRYSFKGEINEWWWYACNYTWGNFPPVYWAYADLINNIKIDYTPLFY